MKKLLPYLITIFTLVIIPATAQVIINPHPVEGKAEARYSYIPDIEIYYDIEKAYFIYWNGSAWTNSDVLPIKYSNYDLNNTYKVMLYDYTGSKPYEYFKTHQKKYPKGYKGPPPEANPKGKYKTEGSPPSELYKIKSKPVKGKGHSTKK